MLWPFDPAAMPEGCVVRDFCQRLGLELEASTIRRVNQGMRRDALCLLYLDRKFNRQRKEAGWRRADAALQRLPGDKVVWADTVLDEKRRRYRADLDWACARLGADLSGVGPARPGGLAREPDLWSPSPSAVAALAEWTGRAPPAPMAAPRPAEDLEVVEEAATGATAGERTSPLKRLARWWSWR
ncbi:hypothetical protein [Ideonella livida]|uniref:Uncharacterized protein n=1 Tax=Ideonella livida TaxID=2707176 RepID=A0A7C9PIU6_9BURK|nr:hypothetical protein [Ideonella livida]NDY93097.1 hypothetical protein [Ideonella livida]